MQSNETPIFVVLSTFREMLLIRVAQRLTADLGLHRYKNFEYLFASYI